MNGISQRLTQLRESRELTKKQLANILHVSDSCISQYENGSSMPGYDTLLSISHYFGVSIDFLLDNIGNRKAFSIDSEFCNHVNYYTLMTRCSKLSPTKRELLLSFIDAFLEE